MNKGEITIESENILNQKITKICEMLLKHTSMKFFGFFLFWFWFLGCTRSMQRFQAVATGLQHSHNNMGSEPHLPPTPQLTVTPDP